MCIQSLFPKWGMEVLKRPDVASHLGPFVLPPALWLHGKRAAHPAAVHRDRRRPPPATTCLLPGSPHHWQNRLHRQPWSHAIQHQSSGDPSAAWEQHESHVSALRPSQVSDQSFLSHFLHLLSKYTRIKTHSLLSLCTFLFASALQTEVQMIGALQHSLLNRPSNLRAVLWLQEMHDF